MMMICLHNDGTPSLATEVGAGALMIPADHVAKDRRGPHHEAALDDYACVKVRCVDGHKHLGIAHEARGFGLEVFSVVDRMLAVIMDHPAFVIEHRLHKLLAANRRDQPMHQR